MNLDELKAALAREEKALANPKLAALMGDKIQSKIDNLKKQIEELQNTTEKKVEQAEKKVEEAKQEVKAAETPAEKKTAQTDLKEAKKDVTEAKKEEKQVEQVAKKVEEAEKKVEKVIEKKPEARPIQRGGTRDGAGRPKIERMERPKGTWGGTRGGAGRKREEPKVEAPKRKKTKMTKPKGLDVKPIERKKVDRDARMIRDANKTAKILKSIKAAKIAKAGEKVKTVRAFGQTVKYKNDAEFCKQLINAFKKRRKASKKEGKRRKTRPVFGVIVDGTKNVVSKALHSVSEKEIQKNPKLFLAKAQRLEKSAIRFLEDFKAILGSDFKKSEITSEFGELEKQIKSFVSRIAKKAK